MPKRPAKLGNNFFGDGGTQFSEQARDEIEQNAGAGHPGNNVDFSQNAQSEADEHTKRAERLVKDFEKQGIRLGSSRDDYIRKQAEEYRGGPATPRLPQDPEEEPSLSKAADDKFWASDEPKKQIPKRL
jgi:hypothetical protein